ncbi:MAG: TonB family protein [Bacteroidales bacterium]
MDAVTTVLLERRREPRGLRKMLAASLVAHAVAGIALVAAPLVLRTTQADDVTPVMTISLPGGSAPGPMNGGTNPMGGRPVQTTEPAAKPEPVRPPAERTPAMTMPAPKGKPAPKTPPAKTLEEGSGRTPTRGTELRSGSAFGETGAQGSGFGLSTGGLGGGGSYLDVANFCCPDYLVTVIQRIKSNWNEGAGAAGAVMMKFTIQRDGSITDTSVEQSSNVYALDAGAQRALARTAKLPPLPPAFTGDHLTVHLKFEYHY